MCKARRPQNAKGTVLSQSQDSSVREARMRDVFDEEGNIMCSDRHVMAFPDLFCCVAMYFCFSVLLRGTK